MKPDKDVSRFVRQLVFFLGLLKALMSQDLERLEVLLTLTIRLMVFA